MSFLKNIFRKHKPEPQALKITLDLNDTDKQLIRDFSSYEDDWRVKEIITLAETGDYLYFKVMQYAILYDPNQSVKFAALKRIHLFHDHPDLKPMLLQMKKDSKDDKLEPYFSMALTKLGLITIEEFKRKVNGG